MRIVMPLFDFWMEGTQKFVFHGNKYSIQQFYAYAEIPLHRELFSEQDISYMRQEDWALVADDPEVEKYKQEINILLLSFRIYKLAPVFIKYRLCKDDISLCSRLNDTIRIVLPNNSDRIVTLGDLNIINEGFKNLLNMGTISNRTHNAIYFMYRGFITDKMIDSFIFLMCAIESLFSNEERKGMTEIICSRVSKFLSCEPRHKEDINKLYDLRSRIVHGKVIVENEIKGKLNTLYKLQDVLVKCMKKMLDEKIYPIYGEVAKKEEYFNNL